MKKSKRNTVSKKHDRLQKKYSKRSSQSYKGKRSEMSRGIDSARKLRAGNVRREVHMGIFSATSRGYGFIKCADFADDVFIPASKTMGALDGDEVRFAVLGRSGERIDGEVTEIVNRCESLIVGHLADAEVYVRRGGRRIPVRAFDFIPDTAKRIPFNVRISSAAAKGATVGERVGVKILEYPTRTTYAIGRVEKIFGAADTPDSAVEAILFSNGIPTEFPKEAIAESEGFTDLTEGELARRLDLRDKVIFTIDSEYAKDLDDAISVERLEDGWLLGVHFADVSHYVKEGGAVDSEAFRRGTSVYYPGSVIPMLPEALSNRLCSLNADSDKLTLSAMIRLDGKGNILFCEVKESVIASSARGVYKELNAILDKSADKEIKKKYSKPVIDMLREAVRLYKVLKRRADKRGCFELESGEAVIRLDESGYPCGIERIDRGVCERLIEQFMLCANEAVARLICARSIPGVYRIHEKPDPEKCAVLLQYAENLGLDIKKMKLRADRMSPSDMQKILASADESGVGRAVSEVLLRSLMKARYAPNALGHYGLALEFYSHFTSPIRRYADLTIHRCLKRALAKGVRLTYDSETDVTDADACPVNGKITEACEAANEGELRALSSERAIDDVYKAFYMKEHIGAEFDAVIVSVTSFGFFAELDNTCEGLVPVSSLGGIGSYDETHMRLTDASGREFTVGMRVRVCLEEVDTSAGKLTFSLSEDGDED